MAEDTRLVINTDQVVSRKRGWATFVDANGTQRSIRSRHVDIRNPDGTINTDTGATMASNGRKRAKKESTGIRTIGGKAVDLTKYIKVKTASGGTSYHNGDEVAERLQGKSLEEVYSIVAKALKIEEKELHNKYKNLNVGMQRMALGNRLRGVVNQKAA